MPRENNQDYGEKEGGNARPAGTWMLDLGSPNGCRYGVLRGAVELDGICHSGACRGHHPGWNRLLSSNGGHLCARGAVGTREKWNRGYARQVEFGYPWAGFDVLWRV